jgi:hypothetical protein
MIRDRIKELRRVKASELAPNPANWRMHPPQQLEALRGMLTEIGYASALLAYETDKGLMLIDGHARAELTPDEEVPVLVLDVNEDEARKLLALFDPVGEMAERDEEAWNLLSTAVSTENAALKSLLEGLDDDITLDNSSYTSKIEAPIYEPKGQKPKVQELADTNKTDALISKLEASNLPGEVKAFLRLAAYRHTVFNYEAIAEFYAHADTETQQLMEDSALIIIDFKKAIEDGYVLLTDRLRKLYNVDMAR